MTKVNLDTLHNGIDTAARDIRDDVIGWRHHLHRHPELSNREEQTAAFIVERLREFGIADITEGVAGHGVVAQIPGAKGDEEGDRRTILLRADIDALPVKEQSGEDFASEVVETDYPGGPFPVAHACGHDTHAAMLLGAAKILHDQRDQLPGDVLLAFQPAEEGAPAGEDGGASLMVEELSLIHI